MLQNNNKTGELSGFYYDLQMRNPLLSVGLYPNTIRGGFDDEGVPVWLPIPEKDQELDSKQVGNKRVKYPYCKYPLCKSIINQDFQVSITNEWTGFGGDEIGALWNSMRPKAPYAKILTKALGEIKAKSDEFESNSNDLGKTVGYIASIVSGFLAKGEAMQAKYLARALDVKGARFTYYTGTGTDFGSNFGLKFTIFPTFGQGSTMISGTATNDLTFLSVTDQIGEILPYVMGDYVPVIVKGLGQDVQDFVSQTAAWQTPPAGFEADIKDVDLIQKGTFKLRIGPYYAIENLVISNINITESKEMVKNPSPDGNGELSPLYAEVNLVLRPASKFSAVSIGRFLSGAASANFRSTEANEADGVELRMRRSLEKIKKSDQLRLGL